MKHLLSLFIAVSLFMPITIFSAAIPAPISVAVNTGSENSKQIAKMEKKLDELYRQAAQLEKEIRDITEEYHALAIEYQFGGITDNRKRKKIKEQSQKLQARLTEKHMIYQDLNTTCASLIHTIADLRYGNNITVSNSKSKDYKGNSSYSGNQHIVTPTRQKSSKSSVTSEKSVASNGKASSPTPATESFFSSPDPYIDVYLDQLEGNTKSRAVIRRVAYNDKSIEINLYLVSRKKETLKKAQLQIGKKSVLANSMRADLFHNLSNASEYIYGVTLTFNYTGSGNDVYLSRTSVELTLSSGELTVTLGDFLSSSGGSPSFSIQEEDNSNGKEKYADPLYTPGSTKKSKDTKRNNTPLNFERNNEPSKKEGNSITPIDPMRF